MNISTGSVNQLLGIRSLRIYNCGMSDSNSNQVYKDRVIFYPVAVVGAVFCISIFVVIATAFGDPLAPANQWVNKFATPLLLFETLLLVTVAIGAMAADRVRTLRRLAVEKKMWVKVCGVTTVEDAVEIAKFNPDAIGLNFYAKSKRCVSVDMAKRIIRSLPTWIEPVGLFVNHSQLEIEKICSTCGIRTIQLHGDETPELITMLKRYRIIKAIRVGEEGLSDAFAELQALSDLNIQLFACLVDANVAGSYGGTGHQAPWELLKNEWETENLPKLILAGGLTPENVLDAIAIVQPAGVDVASGVEAAPGRQDIEKVQQFIKLARSTTSKV